MIDMSPLWAIRSQLPPLNGTVRPSTREGRSALPPSRPPTAPPVSPSAWFSAERSGPRGLADNGKVPARWDPGSAPASEPQLGQHQASVELEPTRGVGGPYRPPIPRMGPVSLWPQLCGAPRRLIATDVKLLQPRRKHDSGEIFLKILYIFIKALTTPKCSALFPSLPPGGGQRRWSNRHHRGNGPTVPLTFDRWPQAHLPLASGGLWPGHP